MNFFYTEIERNILKAKYGLADYIINAFQFFKSNFDFTNKRVLEIGGSSLSKNFLFGTLQIRQWVSVDIIGHTAGSYQQSRFSEHYREIGVKNIDNLSSKDIHDQYLILNGDIADIDTSMLGKFDVLVSICSFEHITNFSSAMKNCHSLLAEGGLLIAQFGPIWSASVGHHIGISENFNHNKFSPLTPWCHLIMQPDEMYRYLIDNGIDEEISKKVVNQTYFESRINRLFYEDYRPQVEHSGLKVIFQEPTFRQEIPKDIELKLKDSYPKNSEFSAYGIKLMATK